MGATKVLIVTNRPAIANSWYDDYVKFVGTQGGYWFVSSVSTLAGRKYCLSRAEYQEKLQREEGPVGIIEFVSLQDLKGSIRFGGMYDKLKEVADLVWGILGIDEAEALEGVAVFHAGTALNSDGELITAGGRVLNVVALADTFEEARERAYEACDKINFGGKQYRRDIAMRAING